MRKGIVVAIVALGFLAGCGNKGDDAQKVPAKPKWPGAAYHLSFDTKPAKPNPAGVTIPAIMYAANPEMQERRATLVVRFDTSAVKRDGPVMNQMIMGPVDVPTAEGTLPADYMDAADKGLATFLKAYCLKGKVKLTVALARSSLSSTATEAELNNKRLSDWTPVEVMFKNPHPGC
ncbi:MAG: lipoprotein [Terracidiphilus sp.]